MKKSNTEIKEVLLALLDQSQLLDPAIKENIDKLNQTQLENLLIITDKAIAAEKKMTKAEVEHFVKLLEEFFNGKKRIYRKTLSAFKKKQEEQFENQEAVLENLLIQQIND